MDLLRKLLVALAAATTFACAAQKQQPAAGDLARRMLDAHNQVRSRVGVAPLTWSKTLEAAARKWAESLLATGDFKHSANRRYGENLYEVRGASASPAQVVSSWAAESEDYDAESNTCRGGAVCGHYTQVVWRNTRQVGCAVARGRGREAWVCNYDPPGNWVGRRPF